MMNKTDIIFSRIIDPIYYILEEQNETIFATHFVKFRAQTEQNSIFQISWKTKQPAQLLEDVKRMKYKRQKISPNMPHQTCINIMYRYTQKCRITIDFDLCSGLSSYIYMTNNQAEYKLIWDNDELSIYPWFGTISPDPIEIIRGFYDGILPRIAARINMTYVPLPSKITFKKDHKWGHHDPFIRAMEIAIQ